MSACMKRLVAPVTSTDNQPQRVARCQYLELLERLENSVQSDQRV